MIEIIFTIDYEIYGNGEGSLKELVYEPTEKLKNIFKKWNSFFVTFIEVNELEKIEKEKTDDSIKLVKQQINNLFLEGFEIGLHLHPQWVNARHDKNKWILNYNEYNICLLPEKQIIQIVDSSLSYLRKILDQSNFVPISFRSGNWLFQPSKILARVLAEKGIKVDSSVFKGGLQHLHRMDYRQTVKNGYFWKFKDDITIPDPNGILLEIPIFTKMVPFWGMLTKKRINLQKKGKLNNFKSKIKINYKKTFHRFKDFIRFWYPTKLDFCRMEIKEFTKIIDNIIKEDQKDPFRFRPIVTIGHTKDLVDFKTVENILAYIKDKKINISNFKEIYHKCR